MSLSQLRPLELGEILDGAFVLYRRHFRTFFGVGLAIHAPLLVLWAAWLALRTWVGLPVVNRVGLGIAWVSWGVAWAACCVPASAAYLGGEMSVWRTLRAVGARLPSLAGAYLLKMIALAGGLAVCVPFLFAIQETFALSAAVMLEGAGPLRALRRSSNLAAGARLHVLAVTLTLLIVTWLPLYAAAWSAKRFWPATGLRWTVYHETALIVLITLARTFLLPLGSIGAVILYYDRRVRTEGLDLAHADAAPAFAVAG